MHVKLNCMILTWLLILISLLVGLQELGRVMMLRVRNWLFLFVKINVLVNINSLSFILFIQYFFATLFFLSYEFVLQKIL